MGVSGKATSEKQTMEGPRVFRTTEKCFDGECSGGSVKEGSYRGSSTYTVSRVLFHSFSARKTVGRDETDHRSEQAQQENSELSLQDGISKVDTASDAKRRVVLPSGSERCLLPYPDSQKIQEVSKICSEQESVPVCSSTVWTDNCAQNLLCCDERVGYHIKEKRHCHSYVPGRLVDSPQRPKCGGDTDKGSAGHLQPVGTVDKCRKVASGCCSGVRFCGSSLQPDMGESFPTGEESEKDCGKDKQHQKLRVLLSEGLDVGDRTDQLGYRSGVSRDAASATIAMVSGESLEEQRMSQRADSVQCFDPESPGLVVRSEQHEGRSPIREDSTPDSDVYRCKQNWLGSSCERQGSGRDLDGSREVASHKCAGVESSLVCSVSMQKCGDEQFSSRCYRQHYSGCIYQSPGGHPFLVADGGNNEAIQSGIRNELSATGKAYPRKSERLGRSVVKEKSSSSHGMVFTPGSVSNAVGKVGETHDRPFCDLPKSQTQLVCEPYSGRLCYSRGRLVNGLERSPCVCLPSNSAASEGDQEIVSFKLQDGSDSANVARSTVVSRNVKGAEGTPNSVAKTTRSSKTTTLLSFPSKSGATESARMDAVKSAVREKGFSVEVSRQLDKSVTKSSAKVYDSRWKLFIKWCGEHKIDHTKISLPQVAEFFLYLFKEGKAVQTIKGYRSAIASVLKLTTGVDISTDEVIGRLISSFEHQRPQLKFNFPKWDLRLVLGALIEPPFEPLQSASNKMLTFKTVFLITLASGARRSEIHALDAKLLSHNKDWSRVTLVPNPKFLAKNFDYKSGERNFHGFVIESLGSKLGPGLEEDTKLCPVRSLRFYLERTKECRRNTDQLFVSISDRKNAAVCKNTIASWIKQTIKFGYENCSSSLIKHLSLNAHEVRALAHSVAFYGNTGMEDLLQGARWSSSTVFTSYYLRDVSTQLDGLNKLGPVLIGHTKFGT